MPLTASILNHFEPETVVPHEALYEPPSTVETARTGVPAGIRALRVALVFAPVRRLTLPHAATIVEEASAVAGTAKPARSSRVSSAATGSTVRRGWAVVLGITMFLCAGAQSAPRTSYEAMTQPDHTGLPQRD